MTDFKHILQKYVDMSYEELLDTGRDAFDRLLPALKVFFKGFPGKQDPTVTVIVLLLANALGADGQLSQKEMAYANAVLDTNHSAEVWTGLIRLHRGPDSEELLNQLLDALSTEDAADMATFLLCLLAVDETISREETALFRRLMG